MKLDVSRAYDRVKWTFLHGVMSKLGFPKRWISKVMECVTTPSFSILINGKPYGNISPSRGLRQGDPLSPYLFLLCAEGFTSLVEKADLEGGIHGVLDEHQQFLTFYLQMTLYYSIGQPVMKLR